MQMAYIVFYLLVLLGTALMHSIFNDAHWVKYGMPYTGTDVLSSYLPIIASLVIVYLSALLKTIVEASKKRLQKDSPSKLSLAILSPARISLLFVLLASALFAVISDSPESAFDNFSADSLQIPIFAILTALLVGYVFCIPSSAES